MDFEITYTPELEAFRKEVQAFIEEHAYKEPIVPVERAKHSPEMHHHALELARKIGEKGWFAPAYPKEYGGGGLDIGRCIILAQEFAKIQEEYRWPGSTEINAIMTGGILARGTEEQKRKFLPLQARGIWDGWECFTEPEAGTDEASMQSTAVRDGDVYIINGTKVFVGHRPLNCVPVYPDYLYWPAITDPTAPRHENLSAFFIPGDLPGLHYTPQDLVAAENQKWEVIAEDVRCPADHLIGEENKGWLVTQATLAAEHGGGGALAPRPLYTLVLKVIDYCKKTLRNGKPLSKDPMVQDILVRLYTEYHVGRLWGLRNFAMAQGQYPRARYTGTQTSLHNKLFSPELGKAFMDILGPLCLIDEPELRVLEGEVEYQTRMSDITHIAGTPETQKIMMSRALGLGRAAARAASG